MFDETTLKKYLEAMNRHLPTKRRLLIDLLKEKEPSYQGKDGTVYRVDREELLYLDSIVNILDKGRLRLPILVSTDTEGENSAWKVSGEVEAKVVANVLGLELDRADVVRFYYPHLNDLRRRLPTTTTVMFMP